MGGLVYIPTDVRHTITQVSPCVPVVQGASMCEQHLVEAHERMREKRMNDAWEKGSKGRPPMTPNE